MFKFFIILFLLLIVEPCSFAGERDANFIAFSDIHFNPFSSCENNVSPCPIIAKLMAANYLQWDSILGKYDRQKIGSYGGDTNYALLKSALTAIHNKSDPYSPQFAMILGDFLGHNFIEDYQLYSGDFTLRGYQGFVKKTLQFLTLSIQKKFPNIPIYPAVGNNDSYDGDYEVVPRGQFFGDIANVWQPLLLDQKNKDIFSREVTAAGYYSVILPHETDHRLIILDSVLFSPRSQNDDTEQAAQIELTWLAQQLKMATEQGQKVWLVMHIPVGIDAYIIARDPFHAVRPYWHSADMLTFLAILNQYSSTITGIFSSHLHMDGFELLGQNKTIPDSFIPAISPIHGNNPGFKIYSYDPQTFHLKDYHVYFLNLATSVQDNNWKLEYDFRQVYQPDCSQCDLIQGMNKVAKTGPLAAAYQHYYAVGHDSQPITRGRWLPYYWCAIWNFTKDDYKSCLRNP